MLKIFQEIFHVLPVACCLYILYDGIVRTRKLKKSRESFIQEKKEVERQLKMIEEEKHEIERLVKKRADDILMRSSYIKLKNEMKIIKQFLETPPRYNINDVVGKYKIVKVAPVLIPKVNPIVKQIAGIALNAFLGHAVENSFYQSVELTEQMPWKYLVEYDEDKKKMIEEKDIINELENKNLLTQEMSNQNE